MRKIWPTPGGIHPPENKHQSTRGPIVPAPVPKRLILPLSQHLGAPSEPVVSVGDQVLKGQLVAKATGAFSASLHAPTSGTITEIGLQPAAHASGMDSLAIVLEADGDDRWIELEPLPNWRELDKPAVLDRIRNSGIVGMGGAGFPSAVKLNPPAAKQISTLILNGTECEPYITADDMLMRTYPEEVVAGARILAWLLNADEVLLGIEDNKPEAIAAMQGAADNTMEVVTFPTKYPSGGEKQLIQILTGKEIPSGGLPADLGIVCQNMGTARAIYRAVELGEPLISRITTLTGEGMGKPGNVDVRLGTPIRSLLDVADADETVISRLIMGGPMMGFALNNVDAPVVKTTNCILAPSAAELAPPPPAQACIRCGMCAEACPASLLPQQLYWYARSEDPEGLERHHLFDCIECGACAYVCPSSIPLVQYYRASKAMMRQQREQQQKAEHSRQRFEQRQARLEAVEQEKEARRAARKQAAANKTKTTADTHEPTTDKSAAINAAVERVKQKKLQQMPEAQRDVVADAIERARNKAQQRGDATAAAPTTSDAEKRASLDARIQKAREKLEQAREAGADTVDALQQGLSKLEQKRAELSADTAPNVDPAATAIERARAKQAAREQESAEDPQAAIRRSIENTEKKLANAEKKLAQAREEGNESTASLLEGTIETLRERLSETRGKLESEA